MVPKYHILFGFIFSIILFFVSPQINFLEAGIIFISSFMMDIDHYFYYVLKKKNINPAKAVKWFFDKRKKLKKISPEKRTLYYSGFYFLHGIETLIILFILGIFLSKVFLLIFIGFVFHLFLDHLEQIYYNERMDKISIIYDFIKFRKMKEIE
jgi:hypothetical protein